MTTSQSEPPMAGAAPAAGRELDARIAREVMGLVLMDRWTDDNPTGYETRAADGTLGLLRAYSTEIVAAWEVVNELHRRVFAHSCGEVDDNPWPDANYLTLSVVDGRGATAAAFTSPDNPEWFEYPEQYGGARGESAAHAICLAALAAVGPTEVSHA